MKDWKFGMNLSTPKRFPCFAIPSASCAAIVSAGFLAPDDEPSSVQKVQPPTALTPSRLGHVKPPSRVTRCTPPPKRSFK